MRNHFLLLSLLMSLSSFSAVSLKQVESSEEGRYLVGLGIQFLVPDQLPGFESSQMVFCPRLYIPVGTEHIQVGVTYGSDTGVYPQLEQIFMAELGYRFDFKTRFFTGFLSGGGQFSRYLSQVGDFKKWGPHLSWGIIFSLAKDFSMGAEMRALFLEKTVLGFGGQFTVAL
ncbi:MAG: hypothetical protein EBQ92_03935 [Proteobacteria bacterium]|nr:hypothetical protein [Pseudomonadota bacterium]